MQCAIHTCFINFLHMRKHTIQSYCDITWWVTIEYNILKSRMTSKKERAHQKPTSNKNKSTPKSTSTLANISSYILIIYRDSVNELLRKMKWTNSKSGKMCSQFTCLSIFIKNQWHLKLHLLNYISHYFFLNNIFFIITSLNFYININFIKKKFNRIWSKIRSYTIKNLVFLWVNKILHVHVYICKYEHIIWKSVCLIIEI